MEGCIKRPLKFQLHRSSILALGCLHWNRIAMSLKKKANGVCYGIISLNRFLSLFRLKFVLVEKGEAMLSYNAPIDLLIMKHISFLSDH